MSIVTASIVLFNTPSSSIIRLLDCLSSNKILSKIYIIDNSVEPINFNFSSYENIYYIKSKNNGYGASHNIALKYILDFSDYHFILNPDIYFDGGVLPKLLQRMDSSRDIGLLMPGIVYPNGENQFLCKLLPTPLDLFLRRFPIPFLGDYIKKIVDRYELQFTGYSSEVNAPSLSGCFMLLRMTALKAVGIFDERYFMYCEDIDLSRRIHKKYKTIFFPDVTIVHEHAKESYKTFRMLMIHISSVVKYFNKWGWFFDIERSLFNRRILDNYRK
jgi:GT2 family glycosyltransferase